MEQFGQYHFLHYWNFAKRKRTWNQMQWLPSNARAQFVVKCEGTAWCKANIVIGSMRKWSFVNTDPQPCFLEVLSKRHQLRFALSLQMIYKLINLILLLDMVLWFSLVAPLADYNTNKHSNIVEHINWDLSELSVRVHKTANRIGRTCISLLSRTYRFSCILKEVLVTASGVARPSAARGHQKIAPFSSIKFASKHLKRK